MSHLSTDFSLQRLTTQPFTSYSQQQVIRIVDNLTPKSPYDNCFQSD